MPEDPLEERVAAVERALCDADDPTALADDRYAMADRVAALEDDVTDLEAAVQAVRGYVGGVRHVNDEVAQRADAAMAKAQSVEHALAEGDRTPADRATPGAYPDRHGRRDSEDSPTADHPTDNVPPDDHTCPRCGGPTAASDGGSADHEATGESTGETTGGATTATTGTPAGNRQRTRADDCHVRNRSRRPDDRDRRSDDHDGHTEDPDRRRPRPGDGRATGVGERRIDGPTSESDTSDEAGLLARLREVL